MPVRRLCRLFAVAPSGFYAWCRRPPSARTIADTTIIAAMDTIHRACGSRYGSRRIRAALRQQGLRVGRHRVRRLMRHAGIVPQRTKTHRRGTTRRNPHAVAAPNRLQQQFVADAPHACWLGDITAIPLTTGCAYLAGVLDLYTRKIVGWMVDTTMETSLVLRALLMAQTHTARTEAVIHHTDQGSQYTSAVYQHHVAALGATMSMSGVGNCYDNAPMESFWATLKSELTHHRRYHTIEELRADIFNYIEIFYNRQRLHSALGYQTPIMVEQAFAEMNRVH